MTISVVVLSGCLAEEGASSFTNAQNIDVDPTNSAPTISGFPPAAVMTGSMYSFTPMASDPDGDPLTFSIQNLPRWATFDSVSGRLSGQTLLGDDGVYENIRITVSDGTAIDTLQAFSITVTQTALGSMTLSWMPPTENTDGTSLTNLAGYNLYFGVSQGNYTSQIRIDNPSISTYVIENLLPDTYYVVATSYNTLGVESTYSNAAVKTVTSQ